MVTGQINVREYRRPKGQSKKDNPKELTTMVTGQINVREYRRPKGQSKKDNFICPVTIVVSYSGLSFFDCPFGLRYSPPFICSVTIVVSSSEGAFKKGQSRVTDNNGHRTNKRWRIQKGQSKKDNPE
jgi:hypothetical protein